MEHGFSGANMPESDVGDDRRDELFDVLSDSRRRFMLTSLQSAQMPVSVEELTAELVAWEAQRPAPDRSDADGDGIAISLIHKHLPKMAEAGFIRYDDTRRTISPTDRIDTARTHLQLLASD